MMWASTMWLPLRLHSCLCEAGWVRGCGKREMFFFVFVFVFSLSVVASFSPRHHHSLSPQTHPHTCFAAPAPPPCARPCAWRGCHRVPCRAGARSPCRPARPRPAPPPPTGRGRARRKVGVCNGVWEEWGVVFGLRALRAPPQWVSPTGRLRATRVFVSPTHPHHPPTPPTPGFVEEMRFVAMQLHTKDQAPKEGGREAAHNPWAEVQRRKRAETKRDQHEHKNPH